MSRTKTSSAIELLVPLDRASTNPLHRQLEQGLREAVRSGRLPSGSTLPSTRALAEQLAVSRGIVVEAYEQLAAEGYLVSRPGGATRVATAARPAPSRPPGPAPLAIAYDFRPGRPDLDLFPRAVWLRSVRRALNEAPSERFGYLDGRGMPELRGALAEYLNRVRGTAAHPDHIVICSGFAQGLKLRRDGPDRGRCASGGARGPDPAGEPRRPSRARDGGRRGPGRRVGAARRHARRRRCRCCRRDRRAPVPDRWRAPAGASVGAPGLGRASWRDDRRGRLRRRVPLRPRTDRRDPGPQPGPRRLRRLGQQDPGAGPAPRLVHRSRRRSPTGSRWRSGPPTSARRRSTSWPSPISSPAASSTATCDGCGRSTAPGATSSSRRWPDTCRSSDRSAPRRDCTSSPGCRRTSRRPRSSRVPCGSASGSRGSGRGRPGRPHRAA